MTSIEKCNRLYIDFDETEDRGYNAYAYFKEIEKDLEILEILRDNIAYVDIVKDQKETLEITIRVKKEDRSKIKEWL